MQRIAESLGVVVECVIMAERFARAIGVDREVARCMLAPLCSSARTRG